MAQNNNKKYGMAPYLHPDCKQGQVDYNAHFDSHFCPHCDKWLTKPCGYEYPDCMCHCNERPEKPSQTEL